MSSYMGDATERVELLSQAIRLCDELRDTLCRIEPSRFTRSMDYLTPTEHEKVIRVNELETTLHARLQDISEKRNVALSPISRLPDDILGLIFQRAHKEWVDERTTYPHYHLPSFTALHNHDVGRILSHTSRRWRAIALDTATLWNGALFQSPKFPPEDGTAELPKAVHPWYRGKVSVLNHESISDLARSKTASLTVGVGLAPGPALPLVMAEYENRICSSRVEELLLDVHTLNEAVFDPMERCISGAGSTLRKLRLTFPGEDQRPAEESWPRFSAVFKPLLSTELPRLVEIQMKRALFPVTLGFSSPHRLRCRSLRIELDTESAQTAAGLLTLLEYMPLLEEFHVSLNHVSIILSDQDIVSELKPVHLPNLHLMQVALREPQRGLLFANLVVPKLEVLALEEYWRRWQPNEWPANLSTLGEVIGLLRPTLGQADGYSSTIRRLCVGLCEINDATDLLNRVPELETLELMFAHHWTHAEECERYAGLIDVLTPPKPPVIRDDSPAEARPAMEPSAAPAALLPKLRTFTSAMIATPWHIRLLTDMTTRRSAAGLRMSRVAIVNWPQEEMGYNAQARNMSSTSAAQYELERALAREVDRLECGGYRWEWDDDGGKWCHMGRGHPAVRNPLTWLTASLWE